MSNIIFLVIALLVIIVLYFAFSKYRSTMSDPHHDHHEVADGGVCCGRHTVCDKGYDNSDLYFDDEELDRFRDRPQDSYTDEEAEEFRSILYSMKEEEVDQWVKCLGTRHIELPAQLKDEVLLILQ